MSDQFTPVASVAFSESNKQLNHPTPGKGNALHQQPVEITDQDDSDVSDVGDFDDSENWS
jgi:hypothetical protein